jgi:hypothetical protein
VSDYLALARPWVCSPAPQVGSDGAFVLWSKMQADLVSNPKKAVVLDALGPIM